MRKAFAATVALLACAIAISPVVLDGCLIACGAVPHQGSMAARHCHAAHAPGPSLATNGCGHDHHQTRIAVDTGQSTARTVLSSALVLGPVPAPRTAAAAINARSVSPPGAWPRAGLVVPLRV